MKLSKINKAARDAGSSAVDAELERLANEGVSCNPFTQEGNHGASLCWSQGYEVAQSFGLNDKQIMRVLRDAHELTMEVYYLKM